MSGTRLESKYLLPRHLASISACVTKMLGLVSTLVASNYMLDYAYYFSRYSSRGKVLDLRKRDLGRAGGHVLHILHMNC